ncbi:uncharacterized protein LOC119677369 [Teleopsis dalmanni]|nr:uncharacterized protein LOC119677369 [Teleopsis dalmanni]
MLNLFKNFLIIVLTIINITNAAQYLSDKPDFLKPCNYEDKSFSKCFANNFQVLFKDWKDGVPGLKTVGKLDPIIVKRIKIVQDPSSGIALNAILDNVEIRGASDAIVEEAV